MILNKLTLNILNFIFGKNTDKNSLTVDELKQNNQNKLFAIILFFSFLSTVLISFIYFIINIYDLSFINAGLSCVYLLIIFINRLKFHQTSKFLFISFGALNIFYINNIFGFNSGIYLYFLPISIITFFIFNYKEKLSIFICLITLSIFSFGSFYFENKLFAKLIHSQSDLKFMFITNFSCCFLVLFIAGYYISLNQTSLIEKLGKEKNTFDKIFNKTFEALILIDRTTRRVLEVNQRACELFKYSKSDFIGLDTNILHKKVYTNLDIEIIDFALQNDSFYKEELEMITSDNITFHAKAISTIISIDKVDYLLFSIHDLTEIKRANRQIASLESAMPGVLYKYYLTKNGKFGFDYISPSCKNLLGFNSTEIIGKDDFFNNTNFSNFYQLQKKLYFSAQNLSLLNWEGELTMPTGEKKWIEIFSMPSKGLDDAIIWNGVMVDITYKKALEIDLQKSKLEVEKVYAAKDDFLATMSHEIRTPLNSVIGMAYLIEQNNNDLLQKERLEVLNFSANNLLALINDVLDYSKINEGKLTLEERNFDLIVLLENIKKSNIDKASSNGILITFSLDVNLPRFVNSDELRITQILNNLISNAIKFTPNGKIDVAVSLQKLEQNHVLIRFEVKDNGIGIEQDKLPTIFDRFMQASTNTQRKFGGSGLGLSICKLLVEQFKGTIWVTSQYGKGTNFAFELPIKLGIKKNESEDDKLLSETILNQKQILLAEDYELNVIVAKGILERWNVIIDIAQNGLIALEMAKNKHYDLILMDLQMPEMNGIEATRQIRMFDKNIPIIALTANVLSDVQIDLDVVGFNDFVSKPFKPDILKEKMSTLIQRFPRV